MVLYVYSIDPHGFCKKTYEADTAKFYKDMAEAYAYHKCKTAFITMPFGNGKGDPNCRWNKVPCPVI
jgi:hypothetical protein